MNCAGQKLYKHKHLFSLMVATCFFNFACAGTSLSVQSSENTGVRESSCSLPISPSNMLSLVIYYKETMGYLTNAEDACRFAFAEILKKEVESSFFMMEGCAKVTLQDIDDALHHPEKLNERLNYLKAG